MLACRATTGHNLKGFCIRRRFSSIEFVQDGVIAIHNATSTPWWASFALSTLIVRATFMPMISLQTKMANRFSRALPDIQLLLKLARRNLKNVRANDIDSRIRIMRTTMKGMHASWRIQGFTIPRFLAYPVLSMSTWILFVVSIRQMLDEGKQSEEGSISAVFADDPLNDGGPDFCKDLTKRDRSMMLPFVALGSTFMGLQIAVTSSKGSLIHLIKTGIQSILILSFPMVMTLPSGVFFYWIPSGMIGIAQRMYFGRKALRMMK